MTDHLRRFGAIEIRRSEYERRLAEAIRLPVRFIDPDAGHSLENIGQT